MQNICIVYSIGNTMINGNFLLSKHSRRSNYNDYNNIYLSTHRIFSVKFYVHKYVISLQRYKHLIEDSVCLQIVI